MNVHGLVTGIVLVDMSLLTTSSVYPLGGRENFRVHLVSKMIVILEVCGGQLISRTELAHENPGRRLKILLAEFNLISAAGLRVLVAR